MKGSVVALLLLTLTMPVGPAWAALKPELEAGEELEARLDADFNGDGRMDLAYVTRKEDLRALHVAIAGSHAEYLRLDPAPLGGAALSMTNGVLGVEDLTGGTSAVQAMRRFRFDAAAKRMRLIGFDATYYSRTFAHDAFEFSWNLLTGRLITRELHLNRGGGDAAYDPIIEKTKRRRADKVWLFDTPDSETLIEELSER